MIVPDLFHNFIVKTILLVKLMLITNIVYNLIISFGLVGLVGLVEGIC
jgi:hypothetical protein